MSVDPDVMTGTDAEEAAAPPPRPEPAIAAPPAGPLDPDAHARMLARVKAELDARDALHQAVHDHLPGAPGCTLPGRAEAEPGLIAEHKRRDQPPPHVGTPDTPTKDVAPELDRLLSAQKAGRRVTVGPDPDLEAARERMYADPLRVVRR